VIHSGERQVDRGGLPATIHLEVPFEVPGGVIRARGPSADRRCRRVRAASSIGADMLPVGILRPGRQRRPLQIPPVALDRARDSTLIARRLLVEADFRACEAATSALVAGPRTDPDV